MAELEIKVPSTYVGPSCAEKADAEHVFSIYDHKDRDGNVVVIAQEYRRSAPGILTMRAGKGVGSPGHRRIEVRTPARRATAKALVGGCSEMLKRLHEQGLIGSPPGEAEIAAAIN